MTNRYGNGATTEIVSATKAGELSALEVTKAAIARMDAINPRLNAVVESLASQACAEATRLDASGAPRGELHGVPVTIKINVDQKDCATSNGIRALQNLIAPDDAPVVRNLRAAGAVIIGRTNTPEFSRSEPTQIIRSTVAHTTHGVTISLLADRPVARRWLLCPASARSRMAMISADHFGFLHPPTVL